MQYLVEVGILGFIIFMAFILYIFYKYIKGYIKKDEEHQDSHFLYLILTMSILLHSLLDFNMSYVFMGMLVFIGLGGMAAAMDTQPVKRLAMKSEGFRPIYSIVIGILSIVLLFAGLRFIQASSAAREAKALESSNSFEERQAAYNKDLDLRPTHIDSIVGLSRMYYQVYQQTKREEFYTGGLAVLGLGLSAEPFNKNMLIIEMRLEQAKGNNDKAFAILENNRANFNWDLDWHNLLITQAFEFGNKARLAKDTANEKNTLMLE